MNRVPHWLTLVLNFSVCILMVGCEELPPPTRPKRPELNDEKAKPAVPKPEKKVEEEKPAETEKKSEEPKQPETKPETPKTETGTAEPPATKPEMKPESKPEEPKKEEPKKEESKKEEPKKEEPKKEEPKTEDANAVVGLVAKRASLKKREDGTISDVAMESADDDALKLIGQLANVEVVKIDFSPNVSNAGVEHLKRLTKLKTLHLVRTAVNGEGMQHLVGLPLEEINLQLSDVSDDGMPHLAKIPSLKRIMLIKTKITDAGIEQLKALENLEKLDLQDVVTVTPACLPTVAELKKLKFLRIYGGTFKGEGIAPIGKMASLRVLSMEQTPLNNATVELLAGLTELKELMLFGTNVSDDGMEKLAGLTKLTKLELRGTGVGVKGMNYLKNMPELLILDISESNANNSVIPQVY